eukprot:SAG31_NODE_240_length_19407_cov_29.686140_7_plen_119_part_00
MMEISKSGYFYYKKLNWNRKSQYPPPNFKNPVKNLSQRPAASEARERQQPAGWGIDAMSTRTKFSTCTAVLLVPGTVSPTKFSTSKYVTTPATKLKRAKYPGGYGCMACATSRGVTSS